MSVLVEKNGLNGSFNPNHNPTGEEVKPAKKDIIEERKIELDIVHDELSKRKCDCNDSEWIKLSNDASRRIRHILEHCSGTNDIKKFINQLEKIEEAIEDLEPDDNWKMVIHIALLSKNER